MYVCDNLEAPPRVARPHLITPPLLFLAFRPAKRQLLPFICGLQTRVISSHSVTLCALLSHRLHSNSYLLLFSRVRGASPLPVATNRAAFLLGRESAERWQGWEARTTHEGGRPRHCRIRQAEQAGEGGQRGDRRLESNHHELPRQGFTRAEAVNDSSTARRSEHMKWTREGARAALVSLVEDVADQYRRAYKEDLGTLDEITRSNFYNRVLLEVSGLDSNNDVRPEEVECCVVL